MGRSTIRQFCCLLSILAPPRSPSTGPFAVPSTHAVGRPNGEKAVNSEARPNMDRGRAQGGPHPTSLQPNSSSLQPKTGQGPPPSKLLHQDRCQQIKTHHKSRAAGLHPPAGGPPWRHRPGGAKWTTLHPIRLQEPADVWTLLQHFSSELWFPGPAQRPVLV